MNYNKTMRKQHKRTRQNIRKVTSSFSPTTNFTQKKNTGKENIWETSEAQASVWAKDRFQGDFSVPPSCKKHKGFPGQR